MGLLFAEGFGMDESVEEFELKFQTTLPGMSSLIASVDVKKLTPEGALTFMSMFNEWQEKLLGEVEAAAEKGPSEVFSQMNGGGWKGAIVKPIDPIISTKKLKQELEKVMGPEAASLALKSPGDPGNPGFTNTVVEEKPLEMPKSSLFGGFDPPDVHVEFDGEGQPNKLSEMAKKMIEDEFDTPWKKSPEEASFISPEMKPELIAVKTPCELVHVPSIGGAPFILQVEHNGWLFAFESFEDLEAKVKTYQPEGPLPVPFIVMKSHCEESGATKYALGKNNPTPLINGSPWELLKMDAPPAMSTMVDNDSWVKALTPEPMEIEDDWLKISHDGMSQMFPPSNKMKVYQCGSCGAHVEKAIKTPVDFQGMGPMVLCKSCCKKGKQPFSSDDLKGYFKMVYPEESFTTVRVMMKRRPEGQGPFVEKDLVELVMDADKMRVGKLHWSRHFVVAKVRDVLPGSKHSGAKRAMMWELDESEAMDVISFLRESEYSDMFDFKVID